MKTGSENFIFAEGKEWEPAGEGVVRQIMGYNDDIMVVKVKFEKGAVGAVHHHIHSQVTYVESGKFEFTINGVKKIVSAGDCLYKEPDAVHGCVCYFKAPYNTLEYISHCIGLSMYSFQVFTLCFISTLLILSSK